MSVNLEKNSSNDNPRNNLQEQINNYNKSADDIGMSVGKAILYGGATAVFLAIAMARSGEGGRGAVLEDLSIVGGAVAAYGCVLEVSELHQADKKHREARTSITSIALASSYMVSTSEGIVLTFDNDDLLDSLPGEDSKELRSDITAIMQLDPAT
jgi:hypothetical protein